MIRIGFIINSNIYKWLGGFYVLKNLINSINSNKNKNIKVILFINKNLNIKLFKSFNAKIVKTDYFNSIYFYKRIFVKICILLFGKSKIYDDFFLKFKIDLISHSLILGRKSQIKSFYWIPDFQHEHYPEYFSWLTKFLRKINVLFAICNSTKIILSSKDSLSDLKKISKSAVKKSFVNSFYFPSFKKKDLIPFEQLKKKFNLPEKFFYVPNQYWKHKNHILILKTLKHIQNSHKINVFVISSGQKYAAGSKNCFDETQIYLQKNKLNKNYRYIGIIKDKEVLSLIYYSLALINPSKFEGWNTSVMQARAMSKTILLSNIGSHIEQKYPKTIYFKNNDIKSLSSKILQIIRKKNKLNLNKKILKKNNLLYFNYGKNYLKNVEKIFFKKNNLI